MINRLIKNHKKKLLAINILKQKENKIKVKSLFKAQDKSTDRKAKGLKDKKNKIKSIKTYEQ